MIYTITLNPAVDKTILVEELRKGEVNRVIDSRKDVGGKGINVSKVLDSLETKSTCTGILGEKNSEFFLDYLTKLGIYTNFHIIPAENRTNIKIVQKNNEILTDINDRGFKISRKDLEDFLSYFLFFVKENDIVVISGSLPEGIEDNIYGYIIKKLKDKKAKVILDADGKPLLEGVKATPYAIKPNIYELKRIVEVDESDIYSVLNGGKYLINNHGIKKVLISLGSEGAVYITESNSLYSRSFQIPIKSTVGAGDAMVAGFVYAMKNGMDDFDTLKIATSCGMAKVMTEGTKKPDIKLIRKIVNDIEIEKLD